MNLRQGLRVTRRAWRRAWGLPPRADSADRRWIEQALLPYWAARDDVRSVLLVGTRWYTRHYPELLPRQRCLTLDIDPAAARHGSAAGHLRADVRAVGSLLPPASIDAVLFNGVFGWGLDDADGLQAALRGLAHVLRPRGELVFGWNNDGTRHCPFDWRALPAWQAYEALPFAPAAGATRLALPTDNRHCFDFFMKVPVR